MKKGLSCIIGLAAALSLSFSTLASAAEVTTTKDLPIGSSSTMEMVGTIEPTIMSVTMPTFVPFSISNSIAEQNKVLSPRINIKNNSNVPIQVDIVYADVDISKLKNTTWSNDGVVDENQIAIGFKKETTMNESPTNLENTRWLVQNQSQDTNILILNSNQEGAMYVVGTLGEMVSESATFNVTPTFVVSRTSNK